MKQKHYTPDQINMMKRCEAIIDEEVRKRTLGIVFDDRVIRAIRATHEADLSIMATILIDHFDASREWIEEFINLQIELLEQYESGALNKGMMDAHIELTRGIKINELADRMMDLVGIEQKEVEGNDSKVIS